MNPKTLAERVAERRADLIAAGEIPAAGAVATLPEPDGDLPAALAEPPNDDDTDLDAIPPPRREPPITTHPAFQPREQEWFPTVALPSIRFRPASADSPIPSLVIQRLEARTHGPVCVAVGAELERRAAERNAAYEAVKTAFRESTEFTALEAARKTRDEFARRIDDANAKIRELRTGLKSADDPVAARRAIAAQSHEIELLNQCRADAEAEVKPLQERAKAELERRLHGEYERLRQEVARRRDGAVARALEHLPTDFYVDLLDSGNLHNTVALEQVIRHHGSV